MEDKTSHCFDSCRTTFEMLGETLYLDDALLKDETTHTLRSRAIDELTQ
jgi:hypothetical protein